MPLERTGRLVTPANPATPEQVALNVQRWRREQAKKALLAARRKAVTAKVTDGHATIGQVVVAHLLREMPK